MVSKRKPHMGLRIAYLFDTFRKNGLMLINLVKFYQHIQLTLG